MDEMSIVENMRDELYIDQEILVRCPDLLLLISCFVLRQFLVQFSARIATVWVRANLVCGVIGYLEVGDDDVHMSFSVLRIMSYHS